VLEREDEITRRTPEANKFCSEWFGRLRHQGPYTPFGMTPSLIMPGTMGGGIAMVFANAGIPVLLKETDQAALDRIVVDNEDFR